jgi:hypothetical protein
MYDPCTISIAYGQILCLELVQTAIKSFIETLFELSPFFSFFYFTVFAEFSCLHSLVVLTNAIKFTILNELSGTLVAT